ncbi:LysM peptidoglycan-binding domain-containing protein [Aggregatilinea lenta]|uniref:LysM peptidoglycan-binding domain-containing protein n=1 Tax=Aggregatilinea lenta TaxID=913108 RepID=UPI000E5BCDB5|nr:LysM peptidoglycan-binding domain-containing protein [Aggregatilinea lenta]
MRAHIRHAGWLVLALVGALALSACYRPAGQDTEPTAVGQISSAATSTLAPVVTEPPALTGAVTEELSEVEATEELVGSPTAEQITPPPSPLPAETEEVSAAALPDGQGGAGATQTQVVAMVPTSSPTPLPSPSPTPLPTQTPIIITATSMPSPTVTLDPALGIPAGASPVPFDRPFPTFTASPVQAAGQEGVPLAERATETLAVVDGQGGQADLTGETPVAVAQQPTLTTNQMTATSVVYGATARAAATLGTQLPPLDAQGGQTTTDQSGVAGQQVLPTATPTATAAPADCGQHLITPGETLSYIAQQYGVATQQMAQANNITNADLIKAGDTLIVPCAQAATTTTTTDTSGQGGQTTTTTGGPTVHVVQAGENIYRISLRYGITMSELLAANGMSAANMNLISVGQELVIPRTATTVVATAAPVVPTATPLPTLAPQGAPAG